MAQQGGGFGKVMLWVVLGIVGIIVAGWVVGALIGALLKILLAALIVAAIAGVAMVAIGALRRSVSGGNRRRQLPR